MMQMSKTQNMEVLFNNLMQNNPEFRSFAEANRGKTFDQMAYEHGVDPSVFHQ